MNELVTVILPVYNGERYVEQMLDSIYRQDYRPMEVIISDDASCDGTVAVIENWLKHVEQQDISFQLIRNRKNIGLSGNITRAAQYIHGKYLFLADQDDIWIRDKITAQIRYLEQNSDCVMCICDRSIIDKRNKVLCRSLFQYRHANIGKRNYNKVLNSAVQYSANCMCLRTEHLQNIFPIPKQICEHDTFIAIMAAHYGKIGYVKRPLTLYRIHDRNLSSQYALETNSNLLKAGYIISRNFRRRNRRECIDPIIIRRELNKRFHEDIVKWSPNLYSGKTEHIYLETVRYIFLNISKWKRFCGEKKIL